MKIQETPGREVRLATVPMYTWYIMSQIDSSQTKRDIVCVTLEGTKVISQVGRKSSHKTCHASTETYQGHLHKEDLTADTREQIPYLLF